jgi:mannose-1-phosphate guanylyltransferase
MNNFYVLLLAGGKGTRLWPLSQPDHPKAMLNLFGERSLFQETVLRLHGLIPPERIFVVARPDLCSQLSPQAPFIPAHNFLHEPCEKDSGPALALGALRIAQYDPSAVIAVLSVDHVIADTERLWEALSAAYTRAVDGWIVALGVPAVSPETRFGYIQRGAAVDMVDNFPASLVQTFVEKPDSQTAEMFVQSGQYCWDSGMIVLSAQRTISELKHNQPELLALVQQGSPDAWAVLQPISLDYALMETAQDILLIEVDLDWHDVGNWDTVVDLLAKGIEDTSANIAAPQAVLIDSKRTFIRSQRHVVAIGLEDLIVVDTEEALLICRRGRSEDIRHAV